MLRYCTDEIQTFPQLSMLESHISLMHGIKNPDLSQISKTKAPAEDLTKLYYQVLNFGMIVSSALMIWKGLMVATGSESPIVVVLSGSMEPAFHRGDLLFLTNRIEEPIRVGEIVVFRIEGREIPIVHRVLKIHEKQNGDIKFLTKGDNNAVDDRGLYKQGQHWLEKKDVVGRARGFVPYIGIVTILMNDYPKFKCLSILSATPFA
uniref:Signal peptidase complex catalytic subunit SEC11 n=1 Tax=Podarcis muralis TaxID=64176 RepID=A0A670JAQ3_PODMU